MILWVRGPRSSGKTTLAKELQSKMPHSILLDGDDMRASISTELDHSKEDRLENNIRIAKLAVILEAQGFTTIVATICPDHVKQEVYWITGCKFITL